MIRSFCALVAAALFASTASAEFLKTGPEVFQSTGKRGKVIVSRETPGIFFIFGDEVPLQTFDPAELKKNDSTAHAFLKFDNELNRYTGLVVGKKEYRIAGSFTLLVGQMRVTVDPANPYCSVVIDQPAPGLAPEILGFMGLNVIVNNVGQQAVALLEANQFTQYQGIVNPYETKLEQLFVSGNVVTTGSIGVSLEVKHACLTKEAMVISTEDLKAVAQAKSKEEGKQLLAATIARSKKSSPLSNLLKLRVTSDSIIGLEPLKGEVRVVKRSDLSTATATVCSMETVKFGN